MALASLRIRRKTWCVAYVIRASLLGDPQKGDIHEQSQGMTFHSPWVERGFVSLILRACDQFVICLGWQLVSYVALENTSLARVLTSYKSNKWGGTSLPICSDLTIFL